LRVAGFTIVRNAKKFDYPVVEAISSILPLCDIFYVGVGNSDDDTRALIGSIRSEKVIIMDSVWDYSLREGGRLLANETNKVFDNIPLEYDWCFYIQADECVHEEDHEKIRRAMAANLKDKSIDGLLFKYKHFYGQFNYIGAGRRWYSHEIRIIRNDKRIRSYRDAQGFRKIGDQKLLVKDTGAFIYHYGWVKPPDAQQAKQQSFHKMWHDDAWLEKHVGASQEYDYSNVDLLEIYKGSHPAVISPRIARANWSFNYDRKKVKRNLKYRILYFIEKLIGWRLGENRNYKLLK
jgi:hypothetical protein